jgi:hypothetical protein
METKNCLGERDSVTGSDFADNISSLILSKANDLFNGGVSSGIVGPCDTGDSRDNFLLLASDIVKREQGVIDEQGEVVDGMFGVNRAVDMVVGFIDA